jgi:hypothetical protein
VHLPGLSRSERRERPQDTRHPRAPSPPPAHLGRPQRRVPTASIATSFARFLDAHPRPRARGGARRPQPSIAPAGFPGGIPPRPRLPRNAVLPFAAAPIGSGKASGRCARDEAGALRRITAMRHQLGVAQPALSCAHRRGAYEPAASAGGQAVSAHRPRPPPFLPAGCPWACGIRPPKDTSHRDHHRPVAQDHDQQEPLKARQHACGLAAPPASHQRPRWPLLFADGVIDPPRPWPTALRCWAGVVRRAPAGRQPICAYLTSLSSNALTHSHATLCRLSGCVGARCSSHARTVES